MGITKLIGQNQTEEQKKKERDQIAGLMKEFSKNARLTELARYNLDKALIFNPAEEAGKALIGAASYEYAKYISPIEKEVERDLEQLEELTRQSLQGTQERFAWQQKQHEEMLVRAQVEAARRIKSEDITQPQSEAVGDAGAAGDTVKPRKKLKPLERETNEGLLLLYEIFKHYKVAYLDVLPASKAWGKIIGGDFNSELISSIAETGKYIMLSGGEKLSKTDFCDKYRRRFNTKHQTPNRH